MILTTEANAPIFRSPATEVDRHPLVPTRTVYRQQSAALAIAHALMDDQRRRTEFECQGFRFVIDPRMPPGRAEFRDALGRIEGLEPW
jgi:hypothetical protein